MPLVFLRVPIRHGLFGNLLNRHIREQVYPPPFGIVEGFHFNLIVIRSVKTAVIQTITLPSTIVYQIFGLPTRLSTARIASKATSHNKTTGKAKKTPQGNKNQPSYSKAKPHSRTII
jgi:hypothetical protein